MKNITVFIISILFFFVTVPVAAGSLETKTAVLPDIVRPRYINTDHHRLYIVEARKRVTGYDINTFEKTFEINARRGKGPGEYVNVPMVLSHGDNIILKTTNKIAYYTRDGKYIRESKLKRLGVIHPLKDGFVFWYFAYSKTERRSYTLFHLLDAGQKTIKQFYKYKAPRFSMMTLGGTRRGKLDMIRSNLSSDINGNRIYIGDPNRGFFIAVFDRNGNKISEIKLDCPKIKITSADRETLIKRYKYIQGISEQNWKRMIKNNDLVCPEYFPAFEKIDAEGGNIYVKTYNSKKDQREFAVIDSSGKEVNRLFLKDTLLWTIKGHAYYFIDYNDDSDEWSLNRAGI